MTEQELYERVLLFTPIEQRSFFDFYKDTVDELIILYPKFYVLSNPDSDITYLDSITTRDIVTKPLYGDAIVDNIIYKTNTEKNIDRKTEFIRKSRLAYKTYWTEYARGKTPRKVRW